MTASTAEALFRKAVANDILGVKLWGYIYPTMILLHLNFIESHIDFDVKNDFCRTAVPRDVGNFTGVFSSDTFIHPTALILEKHQYRVGIFDIRIDIFVPTIP